MNQEKKHLSQDKNIEIVWIITKDMPQDNQIQQQQITYEYIHAQPSEDLGFGEGKGGNLRLSNGYDLVGYKDEQGQISIFDDNIWVPLEQKLAQFQQQIPQQIPQQDQTNNELSLYVEVKDYNNFNKYRGSITAQDYSKQTQGLGEELDELSQEIEKHTSSIFDENSSVFLNMAGQNVQLQFKLQLAKGKKIIDFQITIQLTKVEQKDEEKDKLKKEVELNRQKEKMEKIELDLNQLQKGLEGNRQEFEKQKQELSYQIQQVEQKFHQKVTENAEAIQQVEQKFNQKVTENAQAIQQVEQKFHQKVTENAEAIQQVEQKFNQKVTDNAQAIQQVEQKFHQKVTENAQAIQQVLSNQIQQVEYNFSQQSKKLIQQQQNQFEKVSINNLKQVQEQDNVYISNEKLSGQYEIELLIADDDIEFQVGIIVDDDLGNIEKKNKSYYVVLPDGKFKRGTDEFGNFFTYKLQVDDKLGLRVDTVKHLFQLVINDLPFPPLKISGSIEQFSFIIKSSEDIKTFAQDPLQQ